MKKLFTIAALVLLSGKLFAQIPNRTAATPVPPPLLSREVSGIVKDETGQTVIGALVTLKSRKDTLRAAANEDGIFIFRNVKLATFSLTVESIGYTTYVKRYLNSDVTKRIIIDPIILKTKTNELTEVKINGTPSITYKTDTVEYRASDYKVRDNATLDEMLKKMEGVEIGSDGTMTHQGQQIMKAKLNGKDYAGGDVAQAIQNLPADIIDKIQIVDDYGDQAARTGIKDGDPTKVLNVTTLASRSVGNTARLTGQAGNDDRYNAQIFAQRLNGNQQLGIIANFRNTVNGVASAGLQGGATNNGGGGTGVGGNAGGGGGSPGTTRSGSPSFNYRDQWSKNVQVIGSYAYTFSDNNAINNSFGQSYTSLGPSNFMRNSTVETDSKAHNLRFEMDINLDSANYLQVTPTFSTSSSTRSSNSLSDNVNHYTTGFEHPVTSSVNSTLNSNTNYGIAAFYVHVFKKPRRNFSLQSSVTHTTSTQNGDNNSDFKFYADSTQTTLIKDSLVHLLSYRPNNNTTYNTQITYSEPLGKLSRLDFSGSVRQANYDARSTQDTVLANGQVQELSRLSNIYNYAVTDTRTTLDYVFSSAKVNLTIGATAVPYTLSGTKIDNTTGQGVTTSHSYFRVIPAFRFAYIFSRTERFTLNYTGRNAEPSFDQLQPFTDRSNPDAIVVGNPDLKPSFTNSLNAVYNNYLPNSKFTLALSATASKVDNSIATNRLILRVPLTVNPTDPTKNTYKNISETHYLNLDGQESVVGRYTIAKQFDDRRYSLSLNGNVSYSLNPGMSNGTLYHQTTWRLDERFGPRINPSENYELDPFVGYDIQRSFTTLPNTTPEVKTTSLGLDSRMYFFKTWQVNYSATKKLITGLGGANTTPLVINAGFQKEFFSKRNLVLTFDMYDLLHQNNYLQQTVTATGVTNTLSNTLSRYFLIGLRLNLQKWSGTPQRNGRNMQRRGDGSFIY